MTAEGDDPDDAVHGMADELDPEPPYRERRRSAATTATTPRPLIERIGLAAIALVIALLFGGIAIAAFGGGEPFLGVMGAIGAVMTLWVGAVTLMRG